MQISKNIKFILLVFRNHTFYKIVEYADTRATFKNTSVVKSILCTMLAFVM